MTNSISELQKSIKNETDPIKKLLLIQKRLDLEEKEAQARKEEEKQEQEQHLSTVFFGAMHPDNFSSTSAHVMDTINSFVTDLMVVDTKPKYSTAEAARWIGVTDRTILNYEEAGLIFPDRTSAPRGHKRYSDRDLDMLAFIYGLIDAHGLTAAGVKVVLDLASIIENLKRTPDVFS